MITSNSLKVRLFMEPVDMRKSFNGLGGLLRNVHNEEVNPQYLYVFVNKRKNRLKLFYYDRSGVWVAAKRLEEGTFSWPPTTTPDETFLSLTPEALSLLIDGVDLRGAKMREWYRDSGE